MSLSAVPIRVHDDPQQESVAAQPLSGSTVSLQSDDFPLRIMHVFDRLHLGGTEKIIMKLVKGLDAGLFHHSICTLRGVDEDAGTWASEVDVLDAGRPGAALQFNVLRLARLIKSVRPDIVHTRNWGGIEGILAARLAGVPVIIHSEHGYQLEMKSGLPLRHRLFRHMAYQYATAVFTVSNELRQYHAKQAWWNPDAIRVTHNGVDHKKFAPSTNVRAQVRAQLGYSADEVVVGFVGRMIRLKNVICVLKAVETIIPSIPKVRVLLVGSGPESAALKKYVLESPSLKDRTIFSGASEQVPDLLNAMDMFVLPSLMEGMSNTLLEALATGLPVVATRVGGNPEIVEDSVCGYLFPPDDPLELGRKLLLLARDTEQRERFGRAARDRAVSEFSVQRMLRNYCELYVGLARRRRAMRPEMNYVRN